MVRVPGEAVNLIHCQSMLCARTFDLDHPPIDLNDWESVGFDVTEQSDEQPPLVKVKLLCPEHRNPRT